MGIVEEGLPVLNPKLAQDTKEVPPSVEGCDEVFQDSCCCGEGIGRLLHELQGFESFATRVAISTAINARSAPLCNRSHSIPNFHCSKLFKLIELGSLSVHSQDPLTS